MSDNHKKQHPLEYHIVMAKQQNQKAFAFLLDMYWDDIFSFQMSNGNSPDDAEDITIETFSKAFDKIHLFKSSYSFKTWLFTISKNVHIDLIRKNRNHPLSNRQEFSSEYELSDSESQNYEEKIIREERLNILIESIKKLKPKYQKIIQLRYFQQMSYLQISEVLDESLSNIKVKSHRARKLLEQLLS